MKTTKRDFEGKEEKLKKTSAFIGSCIKAVRKSLGYSQSYMARRLDIAQTTYSNYETGYNKVPAATLVEIARILDTPIEMMFNQQELDNQSQSRKELFALVNSIPIDDAMTLVNAYEIESSQNEDFVKENANIPSVEWAGIGVKIANNVTEQGQNLIKQYVDSIINNPAFLKSV